MATAITPIPLSSFAVQPSGSIGIAFLKSYAAICMEGCVIVLACVIFSAFASAPPALSAPALRRRPSSGTMWAKFCSTCVQRHVVAQTLRGKHPATR